MRRSDREIKSREDILAVLGKCSVMRLAINTPDYPYVVPLNYGVETEGGSITLWFHCAAEGMKLDLIKADRRVGFEADCSHNLSAGGRACTYTMEYESVVGCGEVSIAEGNDAKRQGMLAIMRHYAPERDFDFTDSELADVCVLRLDVARITGKRLKLAGG